MSRRDEDITFSSQEHAESGHQLVIPSLALGPSLMPAPPPRESEVAYGEAIGNVRILILGGQRSLADNLLMRSPQVVHIHGWDHPGGDVMACLEASTILADRDRNVRLTVMPSFDIRDNEVSGLIPRTDLSADSVITNSPPNGPSAKSCKHCMLHFKPSIESSIPLARLAPILRPCWRPTAPPS